MKNTGYYYAVTRVHNHELGLLSKQDLQQLMDAGTLEDCFTILKTKGWGDSSLPPLDVQALLQFESKKVWDLMEELIGEITFFNVFRYSHDYNNLKAAIKLAYSQETDQSDWDRYFMPAGTIPVEQLIEAAQTHDFSALPAPMAIAGKEAYEALAHTGSGQSCDIIVDTAALKVIAQAGKDSQNELLEEYANLTVDSANIKTALRCVQMGKNKDFVNQAIADCGTLDIPMLRAATISGHKEVLQYLERTQYSRAIPELNTSMAAFERWCDNQLMEKIRPQRYAIDGIEPMAAFILARENEIKMVRLVLSAKINQLDPEKINQRMREMYV